MAITQPEIEWFYDPKSHGKYGILCLAGKWVVARESHFGDFVSVTDWLDDRETAIGFLKLLKEE